MSNQHELHLMHRKLHALGSLAQYAVQRLLCCLSIKCVLFDINDTSKKSEKEAKAISEVLSKQLDDVTKISNFFTDPNLKSKIFNEKDNKINALVDAELLDIPSVVSLLMKVKSYPASYPKNRASIACSGNHSSTLSLNIAKCQQPCHFMCGDSCVNMKYVCCDSCKICLKCLLTDLKLKNWHELIFKLVQGERLGDICEMLLVRLSVILIKVFRNFISHLTPGKCQEINSGIISEPQLSEFCKSWSDMQNVFEFAIEQILKYLKNEDEDFSHRDMAKHMEFMRFVTTATWHTDLDIYSEATSKFLQLEKFSFQRVEEKIEQLSAVKSIKVVVKFNFDKPKEFDLKQSKTYNDIFKTAFESYFDKKTTAPSMVTAKLEDEEFQNFNDQKSFLLTFKIESKSNHTKLKDYADYYSPNQKAEKLWENIEKKLKNAKLPDIKNISLKKWVEGSIIIAVRITKQSGEWNGEEITEIEEKMTIFAEEFDFFGDLSKCTMIFKSERNTVTEELPTSKRLVYRLSTFSDEMATSFDNIDVEKFKTCLQEVMSKNKENVTITGMDD